MSIVTEEPALYHGSVQLTLRGLCAVMGDPGGREQQLKRFGRWLAASRRALENESGRIFSQKDAAAAAGISRTQWTRYELGESGVKYDTIPGIARAIRKPLAETYRRAGFTPPDDVYEDYQIGMSFDDRQFDVDLGLSVIEALYTGAPDFVQRRIVEHVTQIMREHQRSQTTHGRRRMDDEPTDTNDSSMMS